MTLVVLFVRYCVGGFSGEYLRAFVKPERHSYLWCLLCGCSIVGVKDSSAVCVIAMKFCFRLTALRLSVHNAQLLSTGLTNTALQINDCLFRCIDTLFLSDSKMNIITPCGLQGFKCKALCVCWPDVVKGVPMYCYYHADYYYFYTPGSEDREV